MPPGGDQGAQGVKYLMIGCYTIPVTRDGASLLPVPGREGAEEDQPLPNLEEDVEGMEVMAEGADQQLPHSDQLLPEEDEPLEEDNNKNVRHAQAMNETWHRLVDEAHNVAVKQITFVEPVKSRAVKHAAGTSSDLLQAPKLGTATLSHPLRSGKRILFRASQNVGP
jgi:hypothetical protein